MRRWNGWGLESIDVEPKPATEAFLRQAIGASERPTDATFAATAAGLPESRLPAHPLVDRGAPARLRHARGQSFPDWVDMRSGRIDAAPDGVAAPIDRAQVAEILKYAADAGARVIPYGGGTSVAGHINPSRGDSPALTVALGALAGLDALDEESQLATFGAGVTGPALEAQLRAHGYTLGHFPQSFEHSTLGGWIATRSSGQQSLRYGRIEGLFVGGHLETPRGALDLPCFPASAAGPDVREMILGSEGRLGIITDAIVRVAKLPEVERFRAYFMPSWTVGCRLVRELAQARVPLSMVRLSNAVETRTQLALAGHPTLAKLLGGVLRLRGLGDERCMLMLGFTGGAREVAFLERQVRWAVLAAGGVAGPAKIAAAWRRGRFRNAYLRNALWERGYGIDTVETAIPWARVTATMNHIEDAANAAIAAEGERGLVFTHLSHVYPVGSSVYSTFVFRLAPDPDATLARWRRLKEAVSEAIVLSGGTISHQHGVGADHSPYLPAEKGALGIAAIRGLMRTFDPDGRMNPGKLC
ncbi:MAG: FAD-binding oxidoreductase [Nannocystaceae bacterium]